MKSLPTATLNLAGGMGGESCAVYYKPCKVLECKGNRQIQLLLATIFVKLGLVVELEKNLFQKF